jgi:hypothetical protein
MRLSDHSGDTYEERIHGRRPSYAVLAIREPSVEKAE